MPRVEIEFNPSKHLGYEIESPNELRMVWIVPTERTQFSVGGFLANTDDKVALLAINVSIEDAIKRVDQVTPDTYVLAETTRKGSINYYKIEGNNYKPIVPKENCAHELLVVASVRLCLRQTECELFLESKSIILPY